MTDQQIVGFGLSHYPPLSGPDERMADILGFAMGDESVAPEHRAVDAWPDDMRAEWGTDRSTAGAGRHRRALIEGFRRIRTALDELDPDVVIIIGDDQYENFREDIIPPYAVLAYDDLVLRPWRQAQASSDMERKPNVWGEGPDTERMVRGSPALAREVASGLLDRGFDAAYAYTPLHHPGLAHAFLNTILYLDWDRTGFDYPVIPLAVNCYGSAVISRKGFLSGFDQGAPPDPPSPTPQRMFALGGALADTVTATGVRAAVIASSSWSHAFLCDKTWRLRPDTPSDRAIYRQMVAQDHATLGRLTRDQLVDAGQHELLNWFVLWGLVDRLDLTLAWSTFVETNVFNSNKVFAIYDGRTLSGR